jgi:hypothetical protein
MSFGLTKQQAIEAVSTNQELAIAHGRMRKSYKASADLISEEEALKQVP